MRGTRLRAAQVSNNDTAGGIDMGIVAYIQCTEACCEAMKERYGVAPRTGHKDGWHYKCAEPCCLTLKLLT